MMRLSSILSVVISALGLANIALGEETFPYTGYISAADVNVRSGPGKDYYPTAQLDRGEQVEVYRRDPGGWLAIRPPKGSFCWTPQRHLRLTKDPEVAEVVSDDAVSWVGSEVKRVQQHKWQVSLEKGELVNVLGIKRMVSPSGGTAETWYKISPPAGEFRWVYGKYVSADLIEEKPASDSSRVVASSAPKEMFRIQSKSIRQTGFRKARRDVVREGKRAAGLREEGPSDAGPLEIEQRIRPVDYKSSGGEVETFRDVGRSFARTESSPKVDSMTVNSRIFDAQLSELDIELSLIASRDPRSWNLTWLRKATESLIEAGKTPLQRGRARLLLDQIEAFEQLQQRRDRLQRTTVVGRGGPEIPSREIPRSYRNNTVINAPANNGPLENNPVKQASFGGKEADREAAVGTGVAPRLRGKKFSLPVASKPTINPRFDVQGWLRTTKTARRSGPLYAIEDENGKLLSYISPSPGLNLHRYLHKQVGLYGQRGYIPRLKTAHLTARRVVKIDRLKR